MNIIYCVGRYCLWKSCYLWVTCCLIAAKVALTIQICFLSAKFSCIPSFSKIITSQQERKQCSTKEKIVVISRNDWSYNHDLRKIYIKECSLLLKTFRKRWLLNSFKEQRLNWELGKKSSNLIFQNHLNIMGLSSQI
jgi:hypothetical protein